MTDKQTKRVPCCYCKELITENAKVCYYCGHYQKRYKQWFNQYINHVAAAISIFFLVVAYRQYNEARKEHIKAQEALERAQKAEKKITDSGIAIAKVLFAQSLLKDSVDSFDY